MAQIGRGRALLVGAVGLALLGALTLIALRPAGDMGYLYTDLDPSAAQAIIDKLKSQNIDFRLSADGTALMAPQDRIAELRMSLAGEQISGRIGYEMLDAEQPFGMSTSREKMNETRAIEGELARSIATLEAVNAARVHIVMPEKALFAHEERKASAAVTLKTRGRLSTENIEAIRSLVAASVPELAPDAVSIVDAKGRLLARAGQTGSPESTEVDEHRVEVEQRLRDQIGTLLEPIVGEGKVRAEVSVEIDREQRREEARVFDPGGRCHSGKLLSKVEIKARKIRQATGPSRLRTSFQPVQPLQAALLATKASPAATRIARTRLMTTVAQTAYLCAHPARSNG